MADGIDFILASGSPRRRQLLADLGYRFAALPQEIDERPRAGEGVDAYVARLAVEKARSAHRSGEIVLAADTIVAVDGTLLGKPDGGADAARMLRRLAGREHEVMTGVAVIDSGRGEPVVEVARTQVVFMRLDDEIIRSYVASGEPHGKAGAYAIQGLGAAFVERIDGNYTNVVGLPLPTAIRLLADAGVPLRLSSRS